MSIAKIKFFKTEDGNIKVCDLYLAAYLNTFKSNDFSFYRKEGGKIYFYYLYTDSLDERIRDYFGRKTLVEPLAFSEAIKSLKMIINFDIER